MDRNIAGAKEKGYTTTILGRRRPIPELRSSDPTQRGFGERMAVNSPIQGSAADLIKVAMIQVNRRLRNELPTTKMILQVHDELIFEAPEEDLEQATQTREERNGSHRHSTWSLGPAESRCGRRKKLAGGASVSESATRE